MPKTTNQEENQVNQAPDLEQEETVETAETIESTEETAPEQEEKPSSAPKKKSRETELEEQVIQLNDNLLRTMAEYDNYRKRSQREKEAIYPQATATVIAQFAPLIDTFEAALNGPCTDEEFKKGVEMIMVQFLQVFEKLGVEQYGAPGDEFNPDLHNAVMHEENDAFESNTISEVFRKGYKMGDRVICHAMVKVAN